MPNWVKGQLEISGPNAEEVMSKLVYEKDSQLVFDFNKIIPMPESIKNTIAGSITDDAIMLYLTNLYNNNDKDYEKYCFVAIGIFNPYKVLSAKEEKEKMANCLHYRDWPEEKVFFTDEQAVYDYGKRILDNVLDYGAKDWYEWSINNWGTKWNACSVEYDEENPTVVCFDTAWSEVRPLIFELSKQYPENTFTYDYAEEDIGVQTGWCEFKGGKIINDIEYPDSSKDAYEKAFELWGECFQLDYRFNPNTNTYEYIEDDSDEEM